MSSFKNFLRRENGKPSPSRATHQSTLSADAATIVSDRDIALGLADHQADNNKSNHSSLRHKTSLPAIDISQPQPSVEGIPTTASTTFSYTSDRPYSEEPTNMSQNRPGSASGHGGSEYGHGHGHGHGHHGHSRTKSRRKSTNAHSEEGHGRTEVLNRHELMRRAALAGAGNGIGAESSETEEDTNGLIPAGAIAVGKHAEVHGDRPGEGSLTFDSFSQNGTEMVSATGIDGAGLAGPGSRRSSVRSTTAGIAPSADPSPARPKLAGNRHDSFRTEEAEHFASPSHPRSATSEAKAGQPVPRVVTEGIHSPIPGNGHGRAATATADYARPSSSPSGSAGRPVGLTKSTTSASLAPPTMLEPLRSPGMTASASTGRLHPNATPSPLGRFRKLSDASVTSKAGKKNGPAAGGIAGALAASGMAGMGVGNAAALEQSHAQAARMSSQEFPSMQKDGSYQGGVYRDPSTGTVIERDHEGNHQMLERRQRSTSSSLSYDGSFVSDYSSASGLGAAAGFSAAHAALLAPLGVPNGGGTLGALPPGSAAGADPNRLTPGGIGAVGGLSPSGMGEGVGILDGEGGWPGEMGAQITGFAVASSKRNADFHALFAGVPEDDYLIEDYGCALVREILIQGRLYISENHVCFNANIFGWVTNLVIPFSEIVSIEKRMTAFVIPNAIQIATLHAKHTFASFLSRDTTYDLIVNIWKLSHPGVPVDPSIEVTDEESEGDEVEETSGEKTDEKAESPGEKNSETPAKPSKRARLRRKLKGKSGTRDNEPNGDTSATGGSGANAQPASRSVSGQGTASAAKKAPHRATTCPCDKEKKHFQTVVMDTTFPAVPEKMYNLMFTSGFMKEFWTGNQKLLDLQMSDWSPDAANNNMLSRSMSYIKPLAGGFGPKQTKCMLTDENLHVDFDDYVSTLTTTRTPDVPSGGSFSVKTRTCLTWAGGNVTKIYVTCTVEWTGRSMIKGIIDKASIDGQKQYYKDLDLAMRQYLKDHATEFKEEGDDEEAVSAAASEAALSSPSAPEKSGAPTDSDDALERAAEKEREGIFKYLDMLNTAVGTLADMGGAAFGTLQDLVGGASPGMLVLALVIASLVISNIWTLTSNRGARDPEDVHRLRRSAGASGSGSVVGGAAANGYAQATYPGAYGGAAPGSPEAIALAVRDVLRDYLEPRYGYGHGNANFNDGPNRKRKREEDVEIEDVHMEAGQIEAMIEQVEARVARLREYLKTVERGEGAETRRIEGGGKGGKEEAAGGSGSGSGKGREAGGKAKSNAKTKG